MTDRELLELAAKAAGIKILRFGESEDYYSPCRGYVAFVETPWTEDDPYDLPMVGEWNPLEDDGDALRLAVEIGLRKYASFEIQPSCVQATCIDTWEHCEYEEFRDQGPYAATRRAIVRAAAEIGRAM